MDSTKTAPSLEEAATYNPHHEKNEAFNDAKKATDSEHGMTLREALKSYPQAVGWSVFVSATCIMQGYDIAVIGQLFAMKAFQKQFGEPVNGIDGGDNYQVSAMWQILLVNGVYIGAMIGTLLNGILSETFGIKRTMMGAHITITGFIFILVFGQSHGMLLAGQLLCGIPLGIFNIAAPLYASEVCPTVLRGYLTTFINLTWVIGQLTSAGTARGVQNMSGKWAYGIPFAIMWIWPVPLLIGLFFCPESPWWLLRQGRIEEAERSLRRLTTRDDKETKRTLAMMVRTDEQERESNSGQNKNSYIDCFKGIDRRRTEIACIALAIQVFSGISMNQYNTYFFEQAGVDHKSAFDITIGYYGLGFCGTVFSWFLLSRFGRRTIFIFGCTAMCTVEFIIGFAALAPSSNKASMWAQSILLIIWVFFYNISVGPLGFCIIAEVGSTRLRSKTIALGRFFFFFWFILFAVATPYMLNPSNGNLKGKTFFVYGGTCLLSTIWAYFRLPETKGRTYEELDILFSRRVPARHFAKAHVNAYAE